MRVLKAFFKDYSVILLRLSASVAFLFTFGSQIQSFLVSNEIIHISDEGVAINALVEHSTLVTVIMYLLFGSCGLLSFLMIRSELGFSEKDYSSLTAPGIILMWLSAVFVSLYKLTEPLPWLGIAFCLLVLSFLAWIFVKCAYSYFTSDYS